MTCTECGKVHTYTIEEDAQRGIEPHAATYYGFTTKAAYDAVQRDKAVSPWIADTERQ
jgi:hypothetical protein